MGMEIFLPGVPQWPWKGQAQERRFGLNLLLITREGLGRVLWQSFSLGTILLFEKTQRTSSKNYK